EAVAPRGPSEKEQASLDLAASHIYELLHKFEPESLKEPLNGDPQNYTRILYALFKLSELNLKLERYRAEVAERKALIQSALAKAGERGITPETRAQIEQELSLL